MVSRASVSRRCLVGVALVGPISGSAHAQSQVPVAAPESASAPDDDADLSSAHPVTKPANRRRFLISFADGYKYQSLFGTAMTGGDVEVVIGADLGSLAIAGDLELTLGSTEYGLKTAAFSAGPLVEGRRGPFRFGGGIRAGAFTVSRVTGSGSLSSLSLGAYARVSIDLFRFELTPGDNEAIFLLAKGSVDAVEADLYGAMGGVGLRF
jgi:hypothetical protein